MFIQSFELCKETFSSYTLVGCYVECHIGMNKIMTNLECLKILK